MQLHVNFFREIFLMAVAGLLISCAAFPGDVFAGAGATGEDIKIIVMSDDSDPLTLASSTSVSKTISTNIKEQFSKYQYYVVDQNAIAATLGFNLSQRMDTKTLLGVAMDAKRSGKAEFDVRGVVIYTVYPRREVVIGTVGQTVNNRVFLEISGEVHDADAARYIGNFGPSPVHKEGRPASAICNDIPCVSAFARDMAADVASMVADEARKKLALLTKSGDRHPRNQDVGRQPPRQDVDPPRDRRGDGIGNRGQNAGLVTTYTIRFENFTSTQVMAIKNVMEDEMPGFVRRGKLEGSAPNFNYGYTTNASQDKLHEWLSIVLMDMGIDPDTEAKIWASGTRFTVEYLGSDLPQRPQSSNEKFR